MMDFCPLKIFFLSEQTVHTLIKCPQMQMEIFLDNQQLDLER